VIIVNIKNFRFVKRFINISLLYYALTFWPCHKKKIQIIDAFQTELTQIIVDNTVAESYTLDSYRIFLL